MEWIFVERFDCVRGNDAGVRAKGKVQKGKKASQVDDRER